MITRRWTHVYDEEVQPAPVVGEVFLEAVSEPLEEHLQNKDVGEDLISVLQHHLHHLPLLDVDVLKGLNTAGVLLLHLECRQRVISCKDDCQMREMTESQVKCQQRACITLTVSIK